MTAPDDAAAAPDDDGDMRTIPGEVVTLALRALTLANHGELDIAVRVIERLNREHPQTGVTDACMTWVDALLVRVPDLGLVDGLGFRNADTGEEGGADDVPPSVRWAGRFLIARARMDADTGVALVAACRDDHEFGQNVITLLQMVAMAFTETGQPLIVKGLDPGRRR